MEFQPGGPNLDIPTWRQPGGPNLAYFPRPGWGVIMHGFPSFLLVGGGAQIGISVFDIILVIMLGFPSFLLVGGGAKIGISVFDIILVIIHGFPSFLLVGVRGEAGLCPKLELLLQGGVCTKVGLCQVGLCARLARLGFVPGWPGWTLPGWARLGFVPGCQVGFARLAPG